MASHRGRICRNTLWAGDTAVRPARNRRPEMGLYDREYTRADFRPQYHGLPQMRMALPRLTPVVKWLLISNIAIHVLKVIAFPSGGLVPETPFETLFAVYPTSVLRALQVWRLITYQFLHWDGLHIFFNMLGLYFLGPTLERNWGGKRFLVFYLACGTAGGVFYMCLVAIGFLQPWPMVGASGAILGMLAACAILFPNFIVFILFFPVPIRVAAIGLTLLYIVSILNKAGNAGGDAAHLAGMAAGAGYVLSRPIRERLRLRSGTYKKKVAGQRMLQMEVDQILEKVHQSGLHSLTAKEKRLLRKATRAEQHRRGL